MREDENSLILIKLKRKSFKALDGEMRDGKFIQISPDYLEIKFCIPKKAFKFSSLTF